MSNPDSLSDLIDQSVRPAQQPQRCLRKSQLTEKITLIDNGTDLLFKDWCILVKERLAINADHYLTSISQINLVWSTTKGLARGYLQTQYTDSNPEYQFQSAEEILDLLEGMFLDSLEADRAWTSFLHTYMCDPKHPYETFITFKSCFIMLATEGCIH